VIDENMRAIKRVSVVLANWCPHCVPLSKERAERMAKDLEVPLRILDIDVPAQLKIADELVEEHGDWAEDYIIPQVFLEYDDGSVEHVLTGFSEGVSATDSAWNTLFSGKYYHSLLDLKRHRGNEALREFVREHIIFEGPCRRHCNQPTNFVELKHESDGVVGAYVCPDGYISRVVYFSVTPDLEWFKKFIRSQVSGTIFRDRDVRTATRHGWELGDEAQAELREISPTCWLEEAYWVVYPQSEAEKTQGIFLCSDQKKGKGCGKLFIQKIDSENKLCPDCC
jgi:thiol-disulfide isomerase/thioredoxin